MFKQTHLTLLYYLLFFVLWLCGPPRAMASSFLRFLDHTQRRTTVCRTSLDEWSACCRDLYLTTHNTHNRQTFMPPVGFEPTISTGEQPQNYALDRAATGTIISLLCCGYSLFAVQFVYFVVEQSKADHCFQRRVFLVPWFFFCDFVLFLTKRRF